MLNFDDVEEVVICTTERATASLNLLVSYLESGGSLNNADVVVTLHSVLSELKVIDAAVGEYSLKVSAAERAELAKQWACD